jgi:hypothetical protein
MYGTINIKKCNLLYFDMVGSSAASLKIGADPVPEK